MTDQSGNAVANYTIATGSGTDYSGPILDRPRLALVPLNAAQLQLSWSTNFPAYTLESSLALPGGWQTVTAAPSIESGEHTLTINASATTEFFRLRKN